MSGGIMRARGGEDSLWAASTVRNEIDSNTGDRDDANPMTCAVHVACASCAGPMTYAHLMVCSDHMA